MLAHLLTSASSYSRASWRATDGEFSTGQQWRGHTDLPLSVPALCLRLCRLKHAHTAASDIKPGPDVGIALN